MLVTLAIFIVSLPVLLLTAVLGAISTIIPSWMNDAISQTLGNSGFLGSILPMQAHPGMWGLAGETGIIPIIGFVLLIGGYIVTIDIVYLIIKFFTSFLPWSTHNVKISKLDNG